MTVSSKTARQAGALLTAVVGTMDIVSALYPAIHSRMELLREVVPLHLIRDAQTATVLVGFCLIVLADGLRKRRNRAMQITVVLLLISSALNVFKGLDFEEAGVALALALGLFANRGAFNVSSPLPPPRRALQHLSTFVLLYYCYVLAGFLILRHVIRPAPSFWGATFEPFRLLIDEPRYQYLTSQAGWFERSLPAVGSVALIFVVLQLLRPLIPRRAATSHDLESVRRLIKLYGNDTLSYFSLQEGRSYFFDPSGEAFLSYRMWGNVALVGGDPVGPADRIPLLIDSFLDFAQGSGIDPCFLGIDGRYLPLYRRRGLKTLKIGEEALVSLPSFDAALLKRKVRRAVRHIGEQGIEAVTYRACEIPPAVMAQMQEISTDWVDQKGGSERGFSMTLGRIPDASDEDCEVTIAIEGHFIWGYIVVVPVYGARGWSLDAMRRRMDSPNGSMEFLVVKAAELYRSRGFKTFSLNFATLCNCENDIDSRALEGTRRFLFENLSSFYQLKSLYQFNSKFEPAWRSRYLAYADVLKFPKVALAVMQSEDPISLRSLAEVFRR
jgi:phosphatidylglycerol lysyltransferase